MRIKSDNRVFFFFFDKRYFLNITTLTNAALSLGLSTGGTDMNQTWHFPHMQSLLGETLKKGIGVKMGGLWVTKALLLLPYAEERQP